MDANGRVVIGGPGNTGLVGVLVKNMPPQALVGGTTLTGVTSPGALAGDTMDAMTHGDIVDISTLVAGTNYFADGVSGALVAGTGAGTNTAPVTAGSKKVGYTIEATRLNVRFGAA